MYAFHLLIQPVNIENDRQLREKFEATEADLKAKIENSVKGKNIKLNYVVKPGDAKTGIASTDCDNIGNRVIQEIEEQKPDQIVVGCRGYHKERAFLGSVSDFVIAHTNVLAVDQTCFQKYKRK